ncbi:MAG: hypothetical protein IJZ26_03350 [Clostridia bacterium]|nr:hypothetical protein [Clostridia bacterium]
MAENKKTSNSKSSSKKTSTSKKSSSKSNVWGINKIAFFTICAVAFLYCIAFICSACGLQLKIVSALQGVATAIMICLVAILAWRYVSGKPMIWKVLYALCILLVLIGIVLPLII